MPLTQDIQNQRVGIGTSSPSTKLDVSGDIKVGNSAMACNSGTAGSVRYNSSEQDLEFCDGANWKVAGAGGWECGDSISYGGESYPTVQIGTQCWFAKNLNIGTRIAGTDNQTNNATLEKYCYGDCPNYGGLYQWDEMMQYTTTAGAQGICPSGWHLPTDAEWKNLVESQATLGCESSTGWQCDPAGIELKSGGLSGFKGLLGGWRTSGGSFASQGSTASFWSSSDS